MCAAIRDETKVFKQQHPSKRPKIPANVTYICACPQPGGARTHPVLKTSTFVLFHDARVCTSTSWPTFSPFQPISGALSASSKHWSGRKRDGGGRGGVSHGERRPVNTCQPSRTKIVCPQQTAHPRASEGPREAQGFPPYQNRKVGIWERCFGGGLTTIQFHLCFNLSISHKSIPESILEMSHHFFFFFV